MSEDGDLTMDANTKDLPALRIDGAEPLSPRVIERVTGVCDAVEANGGGAVLLELSGVPETAWAGRPSVGLVSKWERALRRLERSPAATIAVASGDCGGLALDALLCADYRIGGTATRLVPPVRGGAVWPGMLLYRLAQHGANAAAVRRAALFGEPVDAADAVALRLVHELSDDPAAAARTALGFASGISGVELAMRRQLLFDASCTGFEEALGVHLAAVDRVLRRTDAEPAAA